MELLSIGASVERTIGYLKILLPGEYGFISARGMRSIDKSDKTQVIFETVWDRWEDFENHCKSNVVEEKVLAEFDPYISMDMIRTHIFEEVD